MFWILRYSNLYLILIFSVIIFYVIPSSVSIFYGQIDERVVSLLLLSVFSLAVYSASYFFLRDYRFSLLYNSVPKICISWGYFGAFVVLVYSVVIVYASFTSPQIALFAALQGADINTLAVLREEFLRTRVGGERAFLYLYSICIVAMMPMVVAQLYLSAHKARHFLLLFFLFSLALTLEKGRALVALLPLATVLYNSKGAKKAAQILLILLVFIFGVSFLARGGMSNAAASTVVREADADSTVVGGADGVPDEYNLFKGGSQAGYLINRVVYIPYITALDWLKYKEDILQGQNLWGRSIGLIALMLGEEKVNLEREVFTYQWGQNPTGTGSANTVYYVDAYLNFGALGVFFYTVLLAFIVRVCVLSNNKALMACLSVSVYYLAMHGMPSVLFSGGLGFLFIFSLFFRFKDF